MPFCVPTEHKCVVDTRELGESPFWDQFTDTAAAGNQKAVAYVHEYWEVTASESKNAAAGEGFEL